MTIEKVDVKFFDVPTETEERDGILTFIEGGVMKKHKKHKVKNFEDKYEKKTGRDAFQKNDETRFLDKEKLEDDLIDIPDEDGDHGRIVDSEHPENEEWHTREEQNRNHEKRV